MRKIRVFLGVILAFTLFFVGIGVPVAQAADTIIINSNEFVADTLNGVDAIYRPGGSDGSDAVYSCAAYIKKYYKEVYDVKVYNLFYNSTPKCYGGEKFTKVTEPQIGDIAACNTSHGSTHWAIVKKVNEDDTVTLIEQNWKWKQGGKTVTVKNRTAETNSIGFYRLNN